MKHFYTDTVPCSMCEDVVLIPSFPPDNLLSVDLVLSWKRGQERLGRTGPLVGPHICKSCYEQHRFETQIYAGLEEKIRERGAIGGDFLLCLGSQVYQDLGKPAEFMGLQIISSPTVDQQCGDIGGILISKFDAYTRGLYGQAKRT